MIIPSPSPSVAIRLLLWLVLLVGGATAGLAVDRSWLSHWQSGWIWHVLTLSLGLGLLWLIARVSRTTGRVLAAHGQRGELPRLETNRLVTTCSYGCMRHPMHLGLLPAPLAFALILGSPGFILLSAPAIMLIMVVLILSLEEREAEAKFGRAYRDYRQRVPAFNLRPDCLERLLGMPS